MKHKKLLLLLLIMLLSLSSSITSIPLVRAQTDGPSSEGDSGVYTPGEDDPSFPTAITGFSDFTIQGTAWTVERRGKFQRIKPWGWGTELKTKTTTDEWVHIPVPMPTYVDATAVKISHVEFCARSSAGARTKPIRMDLWADDLRFKIQSISWPADNNSHCAYVNFSPATWKESLGISVYLRFANSADTITLGKAWVRLYP